MLNVLGQIFQGLREMERSRMSYQGVSSFDSLGIQLYIIEYKTYRIYKTSYFIYFSFINRKL